jgi:hypothetical protein
MRKLRATSAVALFSLIFSLLTIPQASAITAGSCNVTVNSSTGVVLVNNGGFCYLAFSATGTNSFTVPAGITSTALLVVAGGGGGGGGAWGGGGGAGGVVFSSSYPLTPSATVNLSIGAGGAGGSASLDTAMNRASNGNNSWVGSSSSFVAIGGGAGAGYAYGSSPASLANGISGGSGGGATEHGSGGTGGSSNQTLPANATVKYGFAGGNSAAGSGYVAGAGGGGAGGAGGAMNTSNIGGTGGAGINVYASWFTALGQFGVNGYIAGGGGGASSTTAGNGGSGGGGAGGGSSKRAGTNGTANTGSGGGGGSYDGAAYVGGNGGSGLIIFRFEADGPATINTSANISIYETTTAITTLTANETVTWSLLSGVDSASVALTGAALSFKTLRDFEAPTDVGANNVYNFTVRATDSVGNTTDLAMSITILDSNEATVISFAAITGSINKGVSKSISVTTNNAGKVRFFMDGKRIPNCIAISTVGSYPNFTATCTWIPAVTNRHLLSAQFTPSSSSFTTQSTPTQEVFILKRNTIR